MSYCRCYFYFLHRCRARTVHRTTVKERFYRVVMVSHAGWSYARLNTQIFRLHDATVNLSILYRVRAIFRIDYRRFSVETLPSRESFPIVLLLTRTVSTSFPPQPTSKRNNWLGVFTNGNLQTAFGFTRVRLTVERRKPFQPKAFRAVVWHLRLIHN